jgi:hypothetical protein
MMYKLYSDQAPDTAKILIQHSLLQNSFFLPPDLRKDPAYHVTDIHILTGPAAQQLFDATPNTTITGDVDRSLLQHIKKVGVSGRSIHATQKHFIVYKCWYESPVSN